MRLQAISRPFSQKAPTNRSSGPVVSIIITAHGSAAQVDVELSLALLLRYRFSFRDHSGR